MKTFKEFLKENKREIIEGEKKPKVISHSNVMKSFNKFKDKYKKTLEALKNMSPINF